MTAEISDDLVPDSVRDASVLQGPQTRLIKTHNEITEYHLSQPNTPSAECNIHRTAGSLEKPSTSGARSRKEDAGCLLCTIIHKIHARVAQNPPKGSGLRTCGLDGPQSVCQLSPVGGSSMLLGWKLQAMEQTS